MSDEPIIEELARIVDPEAFGLPSWVPSCGADYLTDRDEARDKAAAIVARLTGIPAATLAGLRQRKLVAVPSGAVADVAAERQRQMDAEGWTLAHDDGHRGGEMASAAACYALVSAFDYIEERSFSRYWPWHRKWWKPRDRRSNLVRAGALIVAEIERLDRLAAQDRTP